MHAPASPREKFDKCGDRFLSLILPFCFRIIVVKQVQRENTNIFKNLQWLLKLDPRIEYFKFMQSCVWQKSPTNKTECCSLRKWSGSIVIWGSSKILYKLFETQFYLSRKKPLEHSRKRVAISATLNEKSFLKKVGRSLKRTKKQPLVKTWSKSLSSKNFRLKCHTLVRRMLKTCQTMLI